MVDHSGVFIPGIPRGNFRVWELGVLRPILEFYEDRPTGDSAANRHDSASRYRISYQSSGEAAIASQITVELFDTVTSKPLRMRDEKGKFIRYDTLVNSQ